MPAPTVSAFSDTDHRHMARALALAAQAIGLSDPNPRVGCVLVDAQGHVIGEGHTQQAGGPHAEVMALRSAKGAGHDLRGTTAYVTLEPCAHHGRTPPCADALVEAGVARVVAALIDPFDAVAGQGMARLAAAGIRAEVGLGADAARELNLGFFSCVRRHRPWVRMKIATSLDGRTALPNGVSQWITSPEARHDGHLWRRRAGAILTGIGTVLADDPRMDVRGVETVLQPRRVVLDRQLRTPLHARLLEAPGVVLIYTEAAPAERERWLSALAERSDGKASATIHLIGSDALTSTGQDEGMAAPGTSGPILSDLARRGVNELHVEAGARLNGALIREGWVDEYLFYLAPRLLGEGRGAADLGALTSLTESVDLDFQPPTLVGPDLRLLARPRGATLAWVAPAASPDATP